MKDLEKSKAFFTKLGFDIDQQFADDNAACVVIGENIFAMLLKQPFFGTFTKKEISDANVSTEVLIAIDAESREQVDEMVLKAVEAGGLVYTQPLDHGWMYIHGFADLHGHQWEILYTNPAETPYN